MSPGANDPLVTIGSWLLAEARKLPVDAAGEQLRRLGADLYQRLKGAPLPSPPVPALDDLSLDRILCRLVEPDPRDGYVNVASLVEDLESDWKQPDFVPAANRRRARPARPLLIGREMVLQSMLDCQGSIELKGAAGIGKTHLLSELERRALGREIPVWRFSCRPSPLYDPLAKLPAGAGRSPGAIRRHLEHFERPLLWIVEDVHWATPELLEVLGALCDLRHVKVVTSTREGEPTLSPLDASQIHLLVRSMCGPVETELSHTVARLSQGNPLLATTLVRNGLEWGSLPVAAETLLRDRVAALPSETLAVLREAAVQGRQFEPAFLDDPDGRQLARAEEWGLVRDGQFTDDSILDEVLNGCPPEFHLRMAERMLSTPRPPAGLVAETLRRAGRFEACLPWALQGAEEARVAGNLASAAYLYELAARLDSTHAFVAGELQRLRGQWEQAEAHFQKARERATSDAERSRTEAKIGETLWRKGDLKRSREYFQQALRGFGLAPPSNPVSQVVSVLGALLSSPPAKKEPLSERDATVARILDQLAYVSAYQDGLGLIWANLRSLRLTQAARPSRELGVCLASHAVAILSIPQLVGRSRRCIDEAVELLDRFGDPHDRMCARSRQACILLFTGELSRAEEIGRQALAWLETSGDRYDVGICRYNLALALYWQGKQSEALRFARRGWRDGCRLGDWLAAVYSARVLAALGEPPEEFYLHFEEPHAHPHVELVRLEVHGILHLQAGRPAPAVRSLEQALQRSRKLRSSLDLAWQSVWLARAYEKLAEARPPSEKADCWRRATELTRQAVRWKVYPVFALEARRVWQTPVLPKSEGFESLLRHGRAVLRADGPGEILDRLQLAATELLDARLCQISEEPAPAPRLLDEQTLLMPTGTGTVLECRGRKFGPEELRLARYLSELGSAAYEQSEQVQRWRALVEALPTGVALVDASGTILSCNVALEELLGPGLKGKRLIDFRFHEETGEFTGEQRFLGGRGNLVWAEVRTSRLGANRIVTLSDVSSERLRQVAEFQENERRLLAAEVHDVSQPLLGLSYQLLAGNQLQEHGVLQQVLQQMRALMFDLRSPAFEGVDLLTNLRDVVLEVAASSGFEVDLDLSPDLNRVAGLAQLFTYRIVLEGLSNVARHSGAKRARLRLRLNGDWLLGSLSDDGTGLQEKAGLSRRFGLRGIADRCQLLGGWARLRSRPGGGSLLHFRFPWRKT